MLVQQHVQQQPIQPSVPPLQTIQPIKPSSPGESTSNENLHMTQDDISGLSPLRMGRLMEKASVWGAYSNSTAAAESQMHAHMLQHNSYEGLSSIPEQTQLGLQTGCLLTPPGIRAQAADPNLILSGDEEAYRKCDSDDIVLQSLPATSRDKDSLDGTLLSVESQGSSGNQGGVQEGLRPNSVSNVSPSSHSMFDGHTGRVLLHTANDYIQEIDSSSATGGATIVNSAHDAIVALARYGGSLPAGLPVLENLSKLAFEVDTALIAEMGLRRQLNFAMTKRPMSLTVQRASSAVLQGKISGYSMRDLVHTSNPTANSTGADTGPSLDLTLYSVCGDPRIFVVPNFLTASECDSLVHSAGGRWKLSCVVNGHSEANAARPLFALLDREVEHPIVDYVENQIALLTDTTVDRVEPLRIMRYEPGRFIGPHYDGSSRSYSVYIFLNEVPAGGEFSFVYLGVRVPPNKGLAIVWPNDGSEAKLSDIAGLVHAAHPPVDTVKYSLTAFVSTAITAAAEANHSNLVYQQQNSGINTQTPSATTTGAAATAPEE
eukprot:Lankesteria_metandrocarpae@DN3570_c0_g1_i3.p1